MAYDNSNWGAISVNKSSQLHTIYSYWSTTEAIAAISASGYFNDLIELSKAITIKVGDLIMIRATDANAFYEITSITTNVTVSAL